MHRPGLPDSSDPLRTALARRIWESRYRRTDAVGRPEAGIRDTWRRIATALASVESRDRDAWAERFMALLDDFRFLPGGRVLAGAGTTRPVTLFNCFVGQRPGAGKESLAACLDELADLTLAGGGVGTDFSNVPPAAAARDAHADLRGGPLPLMDLWNALCAALSEGRIRHGALMATLRCDHPDIGEFVRAKRRPGALPHFTLSVLATDAFMEASRRGREWPLVFPGDGGEPGLARSWPGFGGPPRACRAWRREDAAVLWQSILENNLAGAEPGLLFIDTIQRMNPLAYAEEIAAVNPCGEIPLPEHGACDLGSFNLTRFVRDPFLPNARLDRDALLAMVPDAVRLLDNVHDASAFPSAMHAQTARASRRIGLGITGLADTLAMLGWRYESGEARRFAGNLMRELCVAAYSASVALAREKGAFPMFRASQHLRGAFVARLPGALRGEISRHGLRNSHLLAIAPTGSISLLANGVSSGLEPLPGLHVRRRVRLDPGTVETHALECHALSCYRERFGSRAPLPPCFVEAGEVSPFDQVNMQAVLQEHVDNAIAKTVQVPADWSTGQLDDLFRQAHALGLKGCTVYRAGSYPGAVLAPEPGPRAADGGP